MSSIQSDWQEVIICSCPSLLIYRIYLLIYRIPQHGITVVRNLSKFCDICIEHYARESERNSLDIRSENVVCNSFFKINEFFKFLGVQLVLQVKSMRGNTVVLSFSVIDYWENSLPDIRCYW